MKKILLIIVLHCIALFAFAQPTFIKDSLDNYINKGLTDWDLPGLAVVIVKDGKVVVAKGFGVKDINTKEPVDAETLFMIASNTKLFTGTALAMLESKKLINLDDKITKYFPDYKLYDDNSTALVSIKDLLSHRIGTKTFQGDFTFFDGNLTRNEIIRRMRYMKPVNSFRQNFGYCNSCFLTAGEVIQKVTNQPWEVFVYDSIVVPLGMKNTHMLSMGISQRKNVATPYTTAFDGVITKVPYDQWDNLAPAASIISNVTDLSHWLIAQINNGKYEGSQILPIDAVRKTRAVNTVVNSNKSSIYPSNFTGYGLGVFVQDYNGRQIFWHTGGASGMVSNVCFVPEEKLGIAILTNQDNQNFFEALRYQILDAYLDVKFTNRSAFFLPYQQQDMKELKEKVSKLKARVLGSKPNLTLEQFVGTYNHTLYGTMDIAKEGNDLKATFNSHNNLTANIKYMDNDEWLLTFSNPVMGMFSVKFNIKEGKVISVPIKVADFIEYDAYEFIKSK